jgi:pimeloyl-ACP methyl ester carboxylesterase
MRTVMSRERMRLGGLVLAGGIAATAISMAPVSAGHEDFPSAGVAPVSACASLAALSLPNTRIVSATPVSGPTNYCAVVGVINQRVSAQDPDHFTYGIGFQVNLPTTWTGRFELMGGGGSDGSLRNPIGAAGTELAQGWAVASNDGGHEDRLPNPFGWTDTDNNAGGTVHFGVDEQAREDYGYNAMGKTAEIAKQIIAHYYGWETQQSYFWGCSNGGREAMVASQRYPDMFDGIVALNPGLDLPKVAVTGAWIAQSFAPLATRTDINGNPYIPDTFPPQDVMVASAAILQACDALDGLVDGIVDNYPACSNRRVYAAFDQFTCSATGLHGNTPHAGTRLTSAQVSALKRSFANPVNSKGQKLYSRWLWDAGIWDPPSAPGAGFSAWKIGTQAAPGQPLVNNSISLSLGGGALPMIFLNPPVVTPVSQQQALVFNFNFDTDAPKIFAKTAEYPQSPIQFMGLSSNDLRHFKRSGGKMILLDSVNDGVFSAAYLIRWYQEMSRETGDAHEFTRLYLVPNMAHCSGGPATANFAGNLLTAVTDWVERHKAPDTITAANTSTSSPFPAGGIFDPRVAANFPTGGTRPLCPFPKTTRYKGAGPTNVASSFVCVAEDRDDHGDRDDDHDDHHERGGDDDNNGGRH